MTNLKALIDSSAVQGTGSNLYALIMVDQDDSEDTTLELWRADSEDHLYDQVSESFYDGEDPEEFIRILSRVIDEALRRRTASDKSALVEALAPLSAAAISRQYGRDPDEVSHALRDDLGSRLAVAGVVVDDARLTHLAYAPEIAQAMLAGQWRIENGGTAIAETFAETRSA